MKQEGITVADSVTFSCLLKAFASIGAIQEGRQLHTQSLQGGLNANMVIGNCLVEMYAKCGSFQDACKVFDNPVVRDVVTWNIIMNAYTELGLVQEALTLYARMEREDKIQASNVTYGCLLKACASLGALQHGKQLHLQILERGMNAGVVVGNCLVDMYAKCGTLEYAREVFDSLPSRDVVTWTSMITGYAKHGLAQEALALYAIAEQEGMIAADNVTFACLLKACEISGALQQGKQLHMQVLERGLDADVVVGSCLVDMYAKCGCLEDVCRVFEKLPEKNVVTWTALLNGFGQSNKGQQAIQCLKRCFPMELSLTRLLLLAFWWHAVTRAWLTRVSRTSALWRRIMELCPRGNIMYVWLIFLDGQVMSMRQKKC